MYPIPRGHPFYSKNSGEMLQTPLTCPDERNDPPIVRHRPFLEAPLPKPEKSFLKKNEKQNVRSSEPFSTLELSSSFASPNASSKQNDKTHGIPVSKNVLTHPPSERPLQNRSNENTTEESKADASIFSTSPLRNEDLLSKSVSNKLHLEETNKVPEKLALPEDAKYLMEKMKSDESSVCESDGILSDSNEQIKPLASESAENVISAVSGDDIMPFPVIDYSKEESIEKLEPESCDEYSKKSVKSDDMKESVQMESFDDVIPSAPEQPSHFSTLESTIGKFAHDKNSLLENNGSLPDFKKQLIADACNFESIKPGDGSDADIPVVTWREWTVENSEEEHIPAGELQKEGPIQQDLEKMLEIDGLGDFDILIEIAADAVDAAEVHEVPDTM